MIPKLNYRLNPVVRGHVAALPTESADEAEQHIFLKNPDFFKATNAIIQSKKEFTQCRDEFDGLIKNIMHFYDKNARLIDPPKDEQNINHTKQRLQVFLDKLHHLNDCHFGNELHIIFGTVKETFHGIDELLRNEKIPKQIRVDTIANMAQGLRVCVGGISTNVQDAYSKLKAQCSGFSGTAKEVQIKMLESTILNFTKKERQRLNPGNEIHFVNALFNYIAPCLGLETRHDEQIKLIEKRLTPKLLEEVKNHALEKLNPVKVSKAIAGKYLHQIKATRDKKSNEPINEHEIQGVISSIHDLKTAQLDNEFGAVDDSNYLFESPTDKSWKLTDQKTLLSKHFINQMINEETVEPQIPIKLNIDGLPGSINILGDLIWREDGTSKAELGAQDLFNIAPNNLQREINKLRNTHRDIDEIYETIVNHIIHIHDTDKLTPINDQWLLDIVKMRYALTGNAKPFLSAVELASTSGCPRTLEFLLSRIYNRGNHENQDGLTPIMLAAKHGHTECVRVILSHDFNAIRYKNNQGDSCISFAIKNDNLQLIERVFLNTLGHLHRPLDRPPLELIEFSISHRSTNSFDYLIKSLSARGITALIQHRDPKGQTFLMQAARVKNNEYIMARLLNLGSDAKVCNTAGFSVLQVSAGYGSSGSIYMLVGAGADINASSRDQRLTPLMAAACMNNFETLSTLLNLKSDLHAKSIEGTTALHSAAFYAECETIEALLTAGADVNARTIEGFTPLSLAARSNKPAVVSMLLNHGADINTPDQRGRSALYHAIKRNNYSVAQHLLESGAAIDGNNEIDLMLQRLIEHAARSGNTDLIDAYFNRVAHASMPINVDGILLTAAKVGNRKMIEHLINNHGSDVNICFAGDTPLLAAVRENNFEAALALHQHGARADLPNQEGITPSQFAIDHKMQDMIHLLGSPRKRKDPPDA